MYVVQAFASSDVDLRQVGQYCLNLQTGQGSQQLDDFFHNIVGSPAFWSQIC